MYTCFGDFLVSLKVHLYNHSCFHYMSCQKDLQKHRMPMIVSCFTTDLVITGSIDSKDCRITTSIVTWRPTHISAWRGSLVVMLVH